MAKKTKCIAPIWPMPPCIALRQGKKCQRAFLKQFYKGPNNSLVPKEYERIRKLITLDVVQDIAIEWQLGWNRHRVEVVLRNLNF